MSKLPYPRLVGWMEANLKQDKRGFFKSMKALVSHYVKESKEGEKKNFISDSGVSAAGKLPADEKAVKGIYAEIAATRREYPTNNLNGVIALYARPAHARCFPDLTSRSLAGTSLGSSALPSRRCARGRRAPRPM